VRILASSSEAMEMFARALGTPTPPHIGVAVANDRFIETSCFSALEKAPEDEVTLSLVGVVKKKRLPNPRVIQERTKNNFSGFISPWNSSND
jgi:hypothetical protein